MRQQRTEKATVWVEGEEYVIEEHQQNHVTRVLSAHQTTLPLTTTLAPPDDTTPHLPLPEDLI